MRTPTRALEPPGLRIATPSRPVDRDGRTRYGQGLRRGSHDEPAALSFVLWRLLALNTWGLVDKSSSDWRLGIAWSRLHSGSILQWVTSLPSHRWA